MNISKIVRSAKCGALGALVAMGMSAVAEPTVTVDKVEAGEPWSMVTVNYTLGGTDAKLEYKVAFDVTAKDQTASVTNDAAKLTDGAATKEVDTFALFGKQVSDTKAKVKVTLIALKPKDLGGVQLWKDGPFWAETNLGESKVAGHPEYGALYKFDEAGTAVKSLLGDEWRVPSDQDLKDLIDTSKCTKEWDGTRKGYIFTGATEGYKDKSIFLPAAGYDFGGGRDDAGVSAIYWSSGAYDDRNAWNLNFGEGDASVDYVDRRFGVSVRAVR